MAILATLQTTCRVVLSWTAALPQNTYDTTRGLYYIVRIQLGFDDPLTVNAQPFFNATKLVVENFTAPVETYFDHGVPSGLQIFGLDSGLCLPGQSNALALLYTAPVTSPVSPPSSSPLPTFGDAFSWLLEFLSEAFWWLFDFLQVCFVLLRWWTWNTWLIVTRQYPGVAWTLIAVAVILLVYFSIRTLRTVSMTVVHLLAWVRRRCTTSRPVQQIAQEQLLMEVAEVVGLRADDDAKDHEIARLRADIQRYKQLQKVENGQFAQSQAELTQLRAEHRTTKTKIKELETKSQSDDAAIARRGSTIEELLSVIDKLEKKERDGEERRATEADLNTQIEALKTTVVQLRSKSDAGKATIKKLGRAVKHVASRFAVLALVNDKVQKEKRETEVENGGLIARNGGLLVQIGELFKELHEEKKNHEQTRHSQSMMISGLIADLTNSKGMQADLQRTLVASMPQVAQLKDYVAQLQNHINQLSENKAALENEVNGLHYDISGLMQTIDSSEKSKEIATENMQMARDSLANSRHELAMLQGNITKLETSRKQLKINNDRLKAEVDRLTEMQSAPSAPPSAPSSSFVFTAGKLPLAPVPFKPCLSIGTHLAKFLDEPGTNTSPDASTQGSPRSTISENVKTSSPPSSVGSPTSPTLLTHGVASIQVAGSDDTALESSLQDSLECMSKDTTDGTLKPMACFSKVEAAANVSTVESTTLAGKAIPLPNKAAPSIPAPGSMPSVKPTGLFASRYANPEAKTVGSGSVPAAKTSEITEVPDAEDTLGLSVQIPIFDEVLTPADNTVAESPVADSADDSPQSPHVPEVRDVEASQGLDDGSGEPSTISHEIKKKKKKKVRSGKKRGGWKNGPRETQGEEAQAKDIQREEAQGQGSQVEEAHREEVSEGGNGCEDEEQ